MYLYLCLLSCDNCFTRMFKCLSCIPYYCPCLKFCPCTCCNYTTRDSLEGQISDAERYSIFPNE